MALGHYYAKVCQIVEICFIVLIYMILKLFSLNNALKQCFLIIIDKDNFVMDYKLKVFQ